MKALHFLTRLSRKTKQFLLVCADCAVFPAALYAAFILRGVEPAVVAAVPRWIFLLAPACAVPVFTLFGIYRAVTRYIAIDMLTEITQAVLLSTAIFALIVSLATSHAQVQTAVLVIYTGVALLGAAGLRVFVRNALSGHESGGVRERVAIYGAGEAGRQLAQALAHSPEFCPVLFLDDDKLMQKRDIHGLPVYKGRRLNQLIPRHGLTRVLFAMPSVSRARQREILEKLEGLPIKVMVMPGLSELASGRKRVDDLREVDIEDLLGREPIPPDPQLLRACIEGKTVMVTGAGGSIGAELCRQILEIGPVRLVLFELSELALYSIERELRQAQRLLGSATEIVALLGSVQDRRRLEDGMRRWSVNTVYHAAAYKHVPLVEYNPFEGIRNNCFGTLHAAQAAVAAGVETFVLISTDKAVRPTNVMGASKRLAELVLQALAAESPHLKLCMVRFGNVLASSGSVVPLFREQIRHGGPVTVTHAEMTRYFMTIPEAAQLVIQAGSMGRHGEVFVLDMGEPVRIRDLAQRMIHLSGLTVKDDAHPDGDVEIVYTGIRPGEKLYEELLITDSDQPTSHPRIRSAREDWLPWAELQSHLQHMRSAVDHADITAARLLLQQLVHGYQPADITASI